MMSLFWEHNRLAIPLLTGQQPPPGGPFDSIIRDLASHGYAVCEHFLPLDTVHKLLTHTQALERAQHLRMAGVGRGQDFHTNRFVRQDKIYWLEPEQDPDTTILSPMDDLRLALNRSLFLGLFDYEAHYANYPPGGFYKTHIDAFTGRSNRKLSTVCYLNIDWQRTDGGALRLYQPEHRQEVLCDIWPKSGTLVVFESERFWHEVLPAHRSRYSIAGWFRINNSTAQFIDPPQ